MTKTESEIVMSIVMELIVLLKSNSINNFQDWLLLNKLRRGEGVGQKAGLHGAVKVTQMVESVFK